MTKRLSARGWVVGWNPESEDWDLTARSGALGTATLRMVVEHHGGPRRLGRLSATIEPSACFVPFTSTTVPLAIAAHVMPWNVVVALVVTFLVRMLNVSDVLHVPARADTAPLSPPSS